LFGFKTTNQQFTIELKRNPVKKYRYSAAEALLEHIKVNVRMID